MKLAEASLPTKYGPFKILVFSSKRDGHEHAVLMKGKNLKGKTVLVRIHSQCLTGDTLLSLRCDCREQLHQSMKLVQQKGAGVIIYLNQEGRGIGLTNKIKAYHLQEKGLDTVEANQKLGFRTDLRDYEVASKILKKLGIFQVILLTNNPDKATQLTSFGITVKKCIPIEVAPNKINLRYLKTKKEKMGHRLKLV